MNKTQSNLLKAFAGESMARNKYTFYAIKARQEGYEWIARVFEETSANEMEHAEREYEYISGKVEMTNTYDINSIGNTLENLNAAAEGENHEWSAMYPDFEKIAREEGEDKIADVFKEIAEVEEKHEERYKILADLLKNKKIFESDNEIEWKCLNCGYIHKGKTPPAICPACGKPHGWYMPIGVVR